MSRVLYREYRPKKLEEVVGQKHIVTTLTNALNSGKIAHAYLFTGPRGVGKTSVARILAHQINNLPYKDDTPHIDIIEIDAASNRRIDEIRELREMVHMAPLQAKYKIYIIDEVHMLTKEAFNALLKTLEEPPAHVIFILATTDAHKLPETIISRTQRFSFKPLEDSLSEELLKNIAKKENIKINDAALKLLAEHGNGSLRDSISLLDQVRSYSNEIGAAEVSKLLGLPPIDLINTLINQLTGQESSSAPLTTLSDLYEQGYPPEQISYQLFNNLKAKLLSGDIKPTQAILDLMSALIETPASFDPSKYLEVIFLKILPTNSFSNEPASEIVIEAEIKNQPVRVVDAPSKKPVETSRIKIESVGVSSELWPEFMSALKNKHNTLYGIVRMSQPDFNEDKLVLRFVSDFHVKRLKEAGNYKVLSDVLQQISGEVISIEIIKDKTIEPKSETSANKDFDSISSIFDGAELVE